MRVEPRLARIRPLVDRVRAEPGATVIIPVSVEGAVDGWLPLRMHVTPPPAGDVGGETPPEVFATLHRVWVMPPRDPSRSSPAARWLGLEGRWGAQTAIGRGESEQPASTPAGWWVLAVNLPWGVGEAPARRSIAFESGRVIVEPAPSRSASLETLAGLPRSAAGAERDLIETLARSPTDRWRAHVLAVSGPAGEPAPPVAAFDEPVLEALAQQTEAAWLGALAGLADEDPVLAARVRDRLTTRLRPAETGSMRAAAASRPGVAVGGSMPAWPVDGRALGLLLDDLLNSAMPPAWRMSRAEAWLEGLPKLAVWTASDAAAVDDGTSRVIATVRVAPLGVLSADPGVSGASPPVVTARSLGRDGSAAGGAWASPTFAGLDASRITTVDVHTTAMVPESGPRRVTAGEALEGAMNAGRGELVAVTSGGLRITRRVYPAPIPVSPPGATVGPLRGEARLSTWWPDATASTDQRTVETGFGPLGGVAGLPGGAGGGGGSIGSPGGPASPGWTTAATLYRDPGRASGWVVYVECERVAPEGEDTAVTDQGRPDSVRLFFGPGEAPSHIVGVTAEGGLTSLATSSGRVRESEAAMSRRDGRWSAWVPVPADAIDAHNVLRLGMERVDARGVRTTWPRTCTPWCADPGRVSFDLAAWGETGVESASPSR